MVVLPPVVACLLKVPGCSLPVLSVCAIKQGGKRVLFSRGTSCACSMLVCEKISPSARGLTEGKLQRIEETVPVEVSR